MFFQILPNIIFILAILGILLMILRRLPEAADLERQQPEELPARQKLLSKGLPVQVFYKIKPKLEFWIKKIWNFALEAKDLKPAAMPGYKFKKIFGRHLALQAKLPGVKQPVNTAEVKNEKHFLEAIKKEPKNLGSYDALGKFYLETGNYSDAKDIYLYLVNRSASSSDYHAKLAFCLYQSEQYEKAVDHYRKSLALDSSQPNRYYNLGLSLEAAGKPQDAAKAFEQAIALEPANRKFHVSLSNLYKKLGEQDKAEDILKQAEAVSGPIPAEKKVKVN